MAAEIRVVGSLANAGKVQRISNAISYYNPYINNNKLLQVTRSNSSAIMVLRENRTCNSNTINDKKKATTKASEMAESEERR